MSEEKLAQLNTNHKVTQVPLVVVVIVVITLLSLFAVGIAFAAS